MYIWSLYVIFHIYLLTRWYCVYSVKESNPALLDKLNHAQQHIQEVNAFTHIIGTMKLTESLTDLAILTQI